MGPTPSPHGTSHHLPHIALLLLLLRPPCVLLQADEFSGQMSPVGGLVYYISPPDSLAAAAANPVHTLFYVAFMLGSELWLAAFGWLLSAAFGRWGRIMILPARQLEVHQLNR